MPLRMWRTSRLSAKFKTIRIALLTSKAQYPIVRIVAFTLGLEKSPARDAMAAFYLLLSTVVGRSRKAFLQAQRGRLFLPFFSVEEH
eukprot:4038303-Amphidinium_carterae.1